jgi:hypothetical protein
MARRRYVRQASSGRWEVLAEGQIRSVVTAETKDKAVERARRLLRNYGGGEVRIVNKSGKVVDSRTVKRSSASKRRAV